ncbi:MAG: hypothetical protein SVU32_04770 [Candidatus Nanohaloarchaea archaeon]|nr:hypothetical protein [Candidatus Nanohaloarchaea archaeon]
MVVTIMGYESSGTLGEPKQLLETYDDLAMGSYLNRRYSDSPDDRLAMARTMQRKLPFTDETELVRGVEFFNRLLAAGETVSDEDIDAYAEMVREIRGNEMQTSGYDPLALDQEIETTLEPGETYEDLVEDTDNLLEVIQVEETYRSALDSVLDDLRDEQYLSDEFDLEDEKILDDVLMGQPVPPVTYGDDDSDRLAMAKNIDRRLVTTPAPFRVAAVEYLNARLDDAGEVTGDEVEAVTSFVEEVASPDEDLCGDYDDLTYDFEVEELELSYDATDFLR